MEAMRRSFIMRNFSEKAREELEKVAFLRGFQSVEKQKIISDILAEYEVGNGDPISQAGPGTNRCAFRLKGYIIKIATDEAGKTDNIHEHRMSHILQPHVTKTYEVSSMGGILICEYVKKMGTADEFFSYSDEVSAILDEISPRYLIGDVGLIAENHTNWGLRFNSNEPIILDYAYAYSVHSSLMRCYQCDDRGLLGYSENYSTLICSVCGLKIPFDEIRDKLESNEDWKSSKDLENTAYKLTSKEQIVVLDKNKSRYLN